MSSRALKNATRHSSESSNEFSTNGLLFRTNSQELTDDVEIDAETNAMVVGPIDIKNNAILTINGNLTII